MVIIVELNDMLSLGTAVFKRNQALCTSLINDNLELPISVLSGKLKDLGGSNRESFFRVWNFPQKRSLGYFS